MNNVQQLFPEPLAGTQSRFAEFWEAYPRRVGKPVAKAKFDQIVNGGLITKTLDKDSGSFIEIELHATADEIIDGAKRYALSQIDKNTYRLKDGGEFIPHPSRWLNQGRWMDEETG